MDANRIWKRELFQREAHLERKKKFSSALVLEGLKSVLWVQSQGRMKYLRKRGLGDPLRLTDPWLVGFLLQIKWILELICM